MIMKSFVNNRSRKSTVKTCLLIFFFVILFSLFQYRISIALDSIPARRLPNKYNYLKNNTRDNYLIDVKNRNIYLNVECHSGTPPIVEFILQDTDKIVNSVIFDFESDGQLDLTIEDIKNEVLFRGVPFRQRGVYKTTVYLNTEYGTFEREFIISFARFVWGKDNFNFANDGKYENAIDFVSKTLVDWALERFGSLNQDQQALLLSVMYKMYIGSIGRCYGFTSEQIYYLNHPSLIPWPHEYAYTLIERDKEIMKRIDYVQNDIVFSNYHTGKINIAEKQDYESLQIELKKIKESIQSGRSIIVGFLSEKMHHSMVVYGYFQNFFRNNTTLLTANNWEREQNNNVFSEDAENIVIYFDRDKPYIEWYDPTKKKYRLPKKIFAIPREDEYPILYNEFFSLLDEAERNIVKKNKIILIVEQTETAFIIDKEGKRKGYSKPRRFNDLDEVTFKKIDYNYVFEIPRDNEYTLTIKKKRYNSKLAEYKDVNLFAIIPDGNTVHAEIFWDIAMEEYSVMKFAIGKDFFRAE